MDDIKLPFIRGGMDDIGDEQVHVIECFFFYVLIAILFCFCLFSLVYLHLRVRVPL